MPVKYDSLCEDGVNFKAFWGALQLGDIETKPGVGPDLSLALGRQSREANPEGAQGQLVAGETSPLPRRFPGSLCCCPVSVSVLGAAGGPAAAPHPEQEPICGPCFSFLLRPKGIHPRAPAGSRVRGPPSAQGPQQAPAGHPLARQCPWARGFRL